ncbi:Neprilysin-11 like protein [Argiope bruennichi]|uniref:Neprilysin-11 like protein n=1 Tax=Argiope bruennichi TaxID=94029 RepID=A0A8T0EBF8_ARGBR|nr:Neprilysin-11 like protein [Argiope bruennichi]
MPTKGHDYTKSATKKVPVPNHILEKKSVVILPLWMEEILSKREFPRCFLQSALWAARLLHSMDLDEDPCEDFYSFVCGNWIKNTFLVGDISTQFTQLNSIIYLRIKEVLETAHGGLAEHENKTQKFYKSCMNFGSRDETGSKVLKKDLEKFGSWPLIEKSWKSEDFNWTDLLVDFYENGYPVDMLFSIGIDMDIKRTSTSLISISVYLQLLMCCIMVAVYGEFEFVIPIMGYAFLMEMLKYAHSMLVFKIEIADDKVEENVIEKPVIPTVYDRSVWLFCQALGIKAKLANSFDNGIGSFIQTPAPLVRSTKVWSLCKSLGIKAKLQFPANYVMPKENDIPTVFSKDVYLLCTALEITAKLQD